MKKKLDKKEMENVTGGTTPVDPNANLYVVPDELGITEIEPVKGLGHSPAKLER